MPLIALGILVLIVLVCIMIMWLTADEKRECDRDTAEHERLQERITRPPRPPRR